MLDHNIHKTQAATLDSTTSTGTQATDQTFWRLILHEQVRYRGTLQY